MVSLSRNVRQPGGGVTFFSDSLNSYHDDDPLLESMPVLPQEPVVSRWMAEEMKKFRTISTPKAILFAKFLYVCLGLSVYLIPVFCRERQCGQQEVTSLMMYVHGGMWFLLLLVHLYLNHEHQRSLLHGYFSFHLETRTLKRAPLFINSGANAIMVVLSKLLDSVCHKDGHCPFLTKTRYLQILVSLEVVIALVLLLVYLVKTLRFNKAKETPDFLRTATGTQTSRSQSQIGYRAPFDMQAWALGQCWNEVYQLRHGCAGLIQEKENLIHRVKEHRSVNSVSIN
ncbi:transmembrane protein 192-like isoform X2 [Littorina saxatilis]|uniref:Transmembrane protein 192 n=1 Tax=Littorina saxatilis TaxID=31220 RepID=A0AAN9GFZ0_9CAEN